MVAPSLFVVLPDRHLAGELAGYFFHLEAWIGVGLGSIALLLLRRITSTTRFDYGLVLATAVAPLISELALHPLLNAARAAGDMQRFGVLHGVSALLFGFACITAALLVWRFSVLSTQASR
jgi:hypothetical protein